MKKLVLVLAGVLGVLAMVRRQRARADERELWREATAAPDLR